MGRGGQSGRAGGNEQVSGEHGGILAEVGGGAIGRAILIAGRGEFSSKFLALLRSADLYAKRRMGFAGVIVSTAPIGTASPASHLPGRRRSTTAGGQPPFPTDGRGKGGEPNHRRASGRVRTTRGGLQCRVSPRHLPLRSPRRRRCPL